MKKFLALFLVIISLFALTSCSGYNKKIKPFKVPIGASALSATEIENYDEYFEDLYENAVYDDLTRQEKWYSLNLEEVNQAIHTTTYSTKTTKTYYKVTGKYFYSPITENCKAKFEITVKEEIKYTELKETTVEKINAKYVVTFIDSRYYIKCNSTSKSPQGNNKDSYLMYRPSEDMLPNMDVRSPFNIFNNFLSDERYEYIFSEDMNNATIYKVNNKFIKENNSENYYSLEKISFYENTHYVSERYVYGNSVSTYEYSSFTSTRNTTTKYTIKETNKSNIKKPANADDYNLTGEPN